MKAYSHLSAEERIRIDELRNRDGLGVRQIALRIGRDKATVSRKRRIDCTWGMLIIILSGPFWRRYKHHPVKTIPWSACSA